MKAAPSRLCIYPKDVMRITGKSERYSRTLLNKIKASLGKEEHQFISIKDFCKFTGLDEECVTLFLED